MTADAGHEATLGADVRELRPSAPAAGEKERRREQARALACDVIEECRVQLMLKFRFLNVALWRMPLEPLSAQMRYPLSTDGSTLYFSPERVLSRFTESFEEAVRDYLHLVLHCVFCHPFDTRHTNAEAWDLACDVTVERAAMDMCAGRFASEVDAERRRVLDELALLEGDEASPAKLYRLFDAALKAPAGHAHRNIGPSKLADIRVLFERDSHDAWESRAGAQADEGKPGDPDNDISDRPDEDGDSSPETEAVQTPEQPEAGEDDEARAQAQARAEESGECDKSDARQEGAAVSDAQADEEGDADSGGGREQGSANDASDANDANPDDPRDEAKRERDEAREQAQREWRDIARQMEMDLHTFSREWGEAAGSLVAALKTATRRRYDYDAFLRRFATLSEEMRINDDEFDYVYYTYGMGLYGNMPLIEPLEYKEAERVRQFVIAIDTSASCSGDLIERFVAHTFDMLVSSQTLSSRVDVHIVQCDSKVQADTHVTDRKDLRAYLDSFTVRGFGGTDFRPVFSYVNDLRRAGELADLKGLVYFTDGLGSFPDKPPGYETAFVFMDVPGKDVPAVPPWAIKLVVDEEDIDGFSTPASRGEALR